MSEETVRARVTVHHRDIKLVLDAMVKALPTPLLLRLAIDRAKEAEGDKKDFAELYYLGLLLAAAERFPEAVKGLMLEAGAEGEAVEREEAEEERGGAADAGGALPTV